MGSPPAGAEKREHALKQDHAVACLCKLEMIQDPALFYYITYRLLIVDF